MNGAQTRDGPVSVRPPASIVTLAAGQREPTKSACALRARAADMPPEQPSTAKDRHQPQLGNMKQAQAVEPAKPKAKVRSAHRPSCIPFSRSYVVPGMDGYSWRLSACPTDDCLPMLDGGQDLQYPSATVRRCEVRWIQRVCNYEQKAVCSCRIYGLWSSGGRIFIFWCRLQEHGGDLVVSHPGSYPCSDAATQDKRARRRRCQTRSAKDSVISRTPAAARSSL